MKKNLLYSSASILFILFVSISFGQLPVYSWANTLGNASGGDDIGNSIATDASGNTYIAGDFNGTVDFDPSAATQSLKAVDGTDFFIAKYDVSGNYVWAIGVGGAGSDVATSIALDASGDIYITGNFSGTVDFDGPGAAFPITSTAGNDVFIAKYNSAGNYLWAKKIGGGSIVSYALALDGSGNVHITGKFVGTSDFDPSGGVANLTAASSYDTFFAKYTTAGIYVWAKSMEGASGDDEGHALTVDGSGNVYVTGHFMATVDFDPSAAVVSLSSPGSYEAFIAKYTSAGVYTWAKSIGGTNAESGNSIALDASANVYITGYYGGTADFDPAAAVVNLTSTGNADIFIAKYTTAGLYTWAKSIGSSTGYDIGNSLKVDGTGNVYVTGNFEGTADFDPAGAVQNLVSTSSYDIFIAKYTTAGLYTWAKNVSGTSFEGANALSLDAGGNVSVTGFFTGTGDFDPSGSVSNLTSLLQKSLFVNKYTTAGVYVAAWASSDFLGGYGRALATIADQAGNVYITGSYRGEMVDFDPSAATAYLNVVNGDNIFLAKYDAAGNYLWAIGMGSNNNNDEGEFLALDTLGNIYVAGNFDGTVDFDPSGATANLTSLGSNNDIFIAKYDASGNYIWAKNIGSAGQPYINDMKVDANGDVFYTGSFYGSVDFDPSATNVNISPIGSQDMYISKLNSSGNFVWTKNYGGAGATVRGFSLALDAVGNIYTTGYYNNTVDFDPSAAVMSLTSLGSDDIFIAKYNSTGDFIWAKNIGGTGMDRTTSIERDISGNLFLTGNFYGGIDFDPSGAVVNIPHLGSSDIFIAKYDSTGNYVWAKNVGGVDDDRMVSSALDVSGNLIITGSFYGTADFDPSAASVNLTSASLGYTDIFIAKYSSSGNYLWAHKLGGITNDVGYGVAVAAGGVVYFAGEFNKTVDFDPSASTANFTGQSNLRDIYLAKYTHCAASSSSTTVVACGSYTLNAQTYTSSGAYTQTLNNVAGCDSVLTINLTITNIIASASQTNVSCYTGSNGTATVVPSGGVPTYLYSWLPSGGTGASASGLSAGTYTCTITDANSCTTTESFTISEPTALTATASQTNVSCNLGANGSATVVASGGTISYLYSWSPSGGTGATASGLSAGTYTCTITDANTCATTESFTISEPTALTATASQTNVSCNLGTNGSATVVANGGTIGYLYSWSPSGGTGATASGLSAGAYTCTITDANTCTTTASVSLSEPAAITSLQTLTVCAGSIIVVGTNTYSATGNYTDVLIAMNGCDSTVTTDLTVNNAIDITTSEISGVITATTSGAIYQWLDCNNSNAIISGEIAQTYTATIGGSYAVSITETGCVDTSACVNIIFTGIQQNADAVNLIVYPNPTAGEFIIKANAEGSYSIVNELGQVVLSLLLNANNNYTSSVSDLNNGIYFIYGVNNDQVVKQKIIVIR